MSPETTSAEATAVESTVVQAETAPEPKKAVAKKSAPKAAAKKVPVKKAPTAKTAKKKAPVKKAPAKKAPAKKAAPKTERADRGPNKTQLAALGVLAKSNKPLTRTQISEKLDNAFIGGTVMGHADPSKLMPNSLVGRGLAKFAEAQDDSNATFYTITAAGRKAMETARKAK